MIGGFLKGALTGTIVAGLVAGTASILTEPPTREAPQAGTVGATPGSDVDTTREDRAVTLPAANPSPEANDPPQVTEPATGDAAPSTDAGTMPAGLPDIDGADTLDNAPMPAEGSDGPVTRGDSPVASEPPSPMPDAAEADQPAPIAAPGADADDTPALQRNAASFVRPRGKPLMAIVLMVDKNDAVRFETLTSFPYPLSIAVDPDWSGAAEAAARYHEAGFEVLLTVDLPQDTAPSDIRAALRSGVAEVPQAVAVLEGTEGGLPVAGAAPILALTGHGLVTRALDADPARGVLAITEVLAAPLQRDLDGQGQDADAVQDGLDQAAANADAQRGVIVLGRMRPDTVRALSLWSGHGGARRVALAPVSAVLSAQTDAPDR